MKTELLWKGFLFAFLLLSLWVFWPIPHSSYPNRDRALCQTNLKNVALAFAQYTQDNTTFPPALNSNSGQEQNDNWVSIVFQGKGTNNILQCPSDETATDNQKTSYGYNANLAGKYEDAVNIILNFEVIADADNWTQTGKNFAAVTASKRHLDGANFSFVDGHAKWMPYKAFTGTKPDPKRLTFDLQ